MTDTPKKDLRSVKLGRLFAEAKKRGIDADQLRNDIAPRPDMIGKRLSKASIADIEQLTHKLGVPGPRPSAPGPGPFKQRYENFGHRAGMATPRQLRYIEAEWMKVSTMPSWTEKQRALNAFLKRIAGVDDMRFVEDWHVQKILNAIDAMYGAEIRKKYGTHGGDK